MKRILSFSGKLLLKSFVAAPLLFQAACQQDYELDLPLAVMQNTLTLDAGGGQTHVLVYAEDDWEASLGTEANWATIEKGAGSGNGEFVFVFELNAGIARQTDVVLTSGSRREVIAMQQKGFLSEAQLTIRNKTMTLPVWESDVEAGFDTNMGLALDRLETSIDYGEGPADWITDVSFTEHAIRFTAAANPTDKARTAQLVVSVRDQVNDKVYTSATTITQSTEQGYMRFDEERLDVESFAKRNKAAWNTNLEMFFDLLEYRIDYGSSGEDWIADVVPETDGVSFEVTENTTSGTREATLLLTYADEHGHTCTARLQIVQDRPALEVPFADLRAMQPTAGSVQLDRDFIIGRVISEPGHANMGLNPHTAWNFVDYSVNATTAYIQSLDGKYGLRIRTCTAADAEALPRYAQVKIALQGLTLTREDDPVRYTLSDFSSESVLTIETGSAQELPFKEKYIAELTDDDLYTYVSLKQVELAFDFGSYGNMHDGFTALSEVVTGGNKNAQTRCDCVPRTLRDIQGRTISMLMNAQTPWRRTGKRVPQGSGTVSGILVHESLLHFAPDGNIGRYQLRPLYEAELRLDPTESFSEKLVEWEWSGKTMTAVSGSDRDVAANTGSGIMTTSAVLSGTKIGRTTAFTGLSFASPTGSYAGRYNGKWWNFTTGEGESVSWNFSTSGITGSDRHLTMVFTAGLGNQSAATQCAPIYWDVQYSTDGTNFTTLHEKLLIYPAPIFAYEKMNMPANLPEYVIELPDALLDQPNVTIRLKAADTVCSTSAGLTKGQVKSSDNPVYFRFEAITIVYNK